MVAVQAGAGRAAAATQAPTEFTVPQLGIPGHRRRRSRDLRAHFGSAKVGGHSDVSYRADRPAKDGLGTANDAQYIGYIVRGGTVVGVGVGRNHGEQVCDDAPGSRLGRRQVDDRAHAWRYCPRCESCPCAAGLPPQPEIGRGRSPVRCGSFPAGRSARAPAGGPQRECRGPLSSTSITTRPASSRPDGDLAAATPPACRISWRCRRG